MVQNNKDEVMLNAFERGEFKDAPLAAVEKLPIPSHNPITELTADSCLIEASAGTGKSFTLIVLYLKFLLGLHQNQKPLKPVQIALFTFTVASAQELKKRVAQTIDDLIFSLRFQKIPKRKESAYLLQLIDKEDCQVILSHLYESQKTLTYAPITTLHGFCKKILSDWAFQTKALIFFDEISSIGATKQCSEWWAQQLADSNEDWINALLEQYSSVESLVDDAKYLIARDDLCIHQAELKNECVLKLKERRQKLEKFKKIFYGHTVDEWCVKLQSSKRLFPRKGIRNWGVWLQKINCMLSKKIFLNWAIFNQESSKFKETHLLIKDSDVSLTLFCDALEDICHSAFDPKPSLLHDLYLFCRDKMTTRRHAARQVTFQDLIYQVRSALNNNEAGKIFSEKLAKTYPIFMIDECQDLDNGLQDILEKIAYDAKTHTERCQLIFVGDPKQSIYGFRGANIFSYFKMRGKIPVRYALSTNYRATPEMLDAVQTLWQTHDSPFFIKDLDFSINSSGQSSCKKSIVNNNGARAALRLYCPNIEKQHLSFNSNEYRQWIATVCANDILAMLSSETIVEEHIHTSASSRKIFPKDVVILVQNWIEAQSIQDALRSVGLDGFYTSDATLLFAHQGAQQLYALFLALVDEPYGAYRRSLTIECHKSTQDDFETALKEMEFLCTKATQAWKKDGIFSAMLILLPKTYVLRSKNLEKVQIDCQKALYQVLQRLVEQDQKWGWQRAHDTKKWFECQFQMAKEKSSTIYLRQECPENTILIVSIFKAKGLEYPIVWVPFSSAVSRKNDGFFNDPQTSQLIWSNSKEDKIIDAQSTCQFSEFMRLFYVATTRSEIHLSLGAASVCRLSSKKSGLSDAHQSPLGYLLQKGSQKKSKDFYTDLQCFVDKSRNIEINLDQIVLKQRDYEKKCSFLEDWSVPTLSKSSYQTDFSLKLSSYSQMVSRSKENNHSDQAFDSWIIPECEMIGHDAINADLHLLDSTAKEQSSIFETTEGQDSIFQEWSQENGNALHSSEFEVRTREFSPKTFFDESLLPYAITAFPKGAAAGSCLHEILECWDFKSKLELTTIQHVLKSHNIDQDWAIWVIAWLKQCAKFPILNKNFSLSCLKNQNFLPEMKFMMAAFNKVLPIDLEKILQIGPTIVEKPPLSFLTFQGGIQGFLDLIFFYQGKYYVLDYKSNWLGYDQASYDEPGLWRAIGHHRYDLQYSLYSLALDAYLEKTLSNYSYEKDFGGVIYYFLRAVAWSNNVESGTPNVGIFNYKMDAKKICDLKKIFGLDESSEGGIKC